VFHGFDALRVLKGVRVKADETRRLRLCAGKALRQDGVFCVATELHGSEADGHDFLHARANILLTDTIRGAETERALIPTSTRGAVLAPRALYDRLFHGPDLHGVVQLEQCEPDTIVAVVSTAPPPASWIRQPLRTTWLADPLVLDCAFHLMTFWSHQIHGAFSLPCHAARYRQFRRTFPRGSLRVVTRITKVTGQTAEADIDFLDMDGHPVARLDGYECVLDAALTKAFRNNRLPSEAMAT
jgi:hypothetical protein